MTRRELLASAAAGMRRPPNVIFLFADDMRHDTIGALGNREIRTPNLDGLARRGVSFSQASIMGGTSGAVCVPSRAMVHSGLTLFHAHDSIMEPGGRAARPYVLLGEHLRRNGYRCFGTGKWHNQPELFARSFDSGKDIFFGGMSDQERVPVRPYDASGRFPKSSERIAERFSCELFTDAAVEFLENRDAQRPYFLYCAYTAPHDPRTAPEEFRRMYDPARVSLPPNFLPQHPFDNGELKVRDELLAPFPRTPEVIRRHIADYYACISYLDSQIGRVLRTMEKVGDTGNTIVVFAGDNGLALGQHGLMGKQSVYEHSVRVPLVLAGPGVERGRRRGDFVYLLDIYPTLCGLCGVAEPGHLEGQSLMDKGRESLLFAYRGLQRAVKTREWKYIEYTVGGQVRRQVFHLRNDPWERNDLSAQSGRLGELQALLREWQRTTDDPIRAAG